MPLVVAVGTAAAVAFAAVVVCGCRDPLRGAGRRLGPLPGELRLVREHALVNKQVVASDSAARLTQDLHNNRHHTKSIPLNLLFYGAKFILVSASPCNQHMCLLFFAAICL